jgi:hypothetical protein
MNELEAHPSTKTAEPSGWVRLDTSAIPADRRIGAVTTLTNLETSEQFHLNIPPGEHFCLPLNSGRYRLAFTIAGHEPYSTLVNVDAGKAVKLSPDLVPDAARKFELSDILRALYAPNPDVAARDFTVPAGQTVELSSDVASYQPDRQTIEIADVDAAKRIIGITDAQWGIAAPRYGSPPTRGDLTSGQAAEWAAREYIFGYSQSVASWKEHINNTIFMSPWTFHLFAYGTVTVNRGGVLRINDNSSFFTCEKLRMHVSSRLEVRGTGPGVIWPASYESFC